MLYRNSGGSNPTFTGVPTGLTGVILGSHAWGDYDADGDPDCPHLRRELQPGEAGPPPSESRRREPDVRPGGRGVRGRHAGSVAFGDHDNDGDLDVLVAGSNGTAATAALYENGGGPNPAFVASSDPLPGVSFGVAAFGDMDLDHDLDIVMSGLPGPPYGTKVLRNTCRPLNTRPGPPSELSCRWPVTGPPSPGARPPTTPHPLPHSPTTSASEPRPVGTEIVAPMAFIPGGLRRLPRSATPASGRATRSISPATGPWYWSVQAIDAAYEGSFFATEQALAQSGWRPTRRPRRTRSGARVRIRSPAPRRSDSA
jgi:hypothetical protein